MATSGSIKDTGSYATVTLSWSLVSQDISKNTSTISYELKLTSTYSISSSASKTYSIVFNGSTVASGTTTVGTSGSKVIKTGTVTIPHNSDGTKTFSYSFKQQMDVTLSGTWVGTLSASGSGTPTTIPRTSKPTLSATSVNYGASVTIYTNRASSSFTHTLRYSWNGYSGDIVVKTTSASYVWTVPLTFMNYIPSATSSWGTIYCDTYSGTTKIGTESVKLTTNVPSNIVPSFSSVGFAEGNSAVTIGAYVQGVSKIKITANSPQGAYSSTIKSYKITFDGSTYSTSPATTGAVKGSGSLEASVTITDSRGRTANKKASITVLPYKKPNITKLTATRANSDGTDNPFGTYAKIVREASCSSLKVGTVEKNVLKYTIQTKLRTASLYDTKVTLTTHSGVSLTGSNTVGTYDITKSYDVYIEVSDLFDKATATELISTGEVTMSWGRSGVGIGKVWEKGALDIGGDMYISGKMFGNLGSQRIPANDDLNNYMAEGMYYCPANVDVQTLSNLPIHATGAPIGQAFSLLVEKHAGWKQTLTTYPGTWWMTYVRNYYNGSWGSWTHIEGSTNWTTLPLVSGITEYSASYTPAYCRMGETVWIRGAVKGIIAPDTQIATLPVGFRPTMTESFGPPTTGTAQARWSISTNGAVRLEQVSSGTPASTWWFPLSFSFVCV